MKRMFACVLGCAFAVMTALSAAACKPSEEQGASPRADATVTVFTTNDMHGNLVGDETKTIGIVKAAEIKASTENAILADAGDATQGASFASVSRGADVIRMMNAAGYDLMAAGNHEFDYGADVLLENAELADFPILAANVKKDGKLLLESSTVIERADYKLGFIGLTTVSTATSTNPSLLSGVSFEEEVATAKAEIAALKDKTDAIVLVCHMGDNGTAVSCTSEQLLKGLTAAERSEIAAVIDGHSHTVEEKTVEGIPVVQTGVNFTGLGKLTLSFRDGKDGAVVSAAGEMLDYAAAMGYETTEAGEKKAQKVKETLDAIELQQGEILNEKLCELVTPLWGGNITWNYSETRLVETSYGDFVTDAFLHYAEQFAENEKLAFPVVAVENGGGISMPLPTSYTSGTVVTRKDVLSAFNHGNLVEVLKVTPADLFQAIEKGLVTTGQDASGLLLRKSVSGSFLQCSGFSYTYDPAGVQGNKVTEVKLANGTVLERADAEMTILLATNNYVSTFFANAEKIGELGGEDMIVEDYILLLTENGTKPLDYRCEYGRILIANDKSPETYTVKLPVMMGGAAQKGRTVHLFVDGKAQGEVTTDSDGYLTVTLPKGAHTLSLQEAKNLIYVNNYSGTGAIGIEDGEEGFYTKTGYYCFFFDCAE